MKVTLRLFAQLKEILQEEELFLESHAPLSCKEVALQLAQKHPGVTGLLKQCAVACNGVLVPSDTLLKNGDEMALLPPVSGG